MKPTPPASPLPVPAVIRSGADVFAPRFLETKKAVDKLGTGIRALEDKAREGGGAAAAERQRAKGRLTARERVAGLLDPESPWLEVGLLAAHGMYGEWGGAPSAGVVAGLGKVRGRWVLVVANDATVKAGAFFPMTVKKVLRCQTISIENRVPVVYLVDSSGVFLPLQDEIFPDLDDFGRIFRHNAVLSALGVPQITAVMGNCVAGGAYLPVMCDTLLMTEGSGLYLAGPSLVKAAIGKEVGSEELGGARLHMERSGTVDFREKDDGACLERIRSLVALWGPPPPPPFDRIAPREPAHPAGDIKGFVPPDGAAAYDVREVLARVLDASEFEEYKADYGRTLVCGYGRIGGFAAGIVANQRTNIWSEGRPPEFGGVVYTEAAEKAARFVLACNQSRIPLVFLHDVNGFMVGPEAEASGIIRAGAKLVNVVSNSVVPKVTVILGGSYGAGHYALCGRAYDPRFLFAWPTARYAVMGGAQASATLLELRLGALKREGKELSAAEREALAAEIRSRYAESEDPAYAAARLWVDAIIRPEDTRAILVHCLEVAGLNPEVPPLRTGVIQT